MWGGRCLVKFIPSWSVLAAGTSPWQSKLIQGHAFLPCILGVISSPADTLSHENHLSCCTQCLTSPPANSLLKIMSHQELIPLHPSLSWFARSKIGHGGHGGDVLRPFLSSNSAIWEFISPVTKPGSAPSPSEELWGCTFPDTGKGFHPDPGWGKCQASFAPLCWRRLEASWTDEIIVAIINKIIK